MDALPFLRQWPLIAKCEAAAMWMPSQFAPFSKHLFAFVMICADQWMHPCFVVKSCGFVAY